MKRFFITFLVVVFTTLLAAFGVYFFVLSDSQIENNPGTIAEATPTLDVTPSPAPLITPTPAPPTPTPTPEPTPTPTPHPWEVFSPSPLASTDPATFPGFGFANQLAEGETITDLFFGMPEDYYLLPGVTTFRGNNFRNGGAWGYADVTNGTLREIYRINVGTMSSWTGVGWVGQPVIIQWPDEVRNVMNIHPHMNREGLVEVIQAALDGFIYFFDLYTGQETRPRINHGNPIKGGAALDPRGYPLLFVGQGDEIFGSRFGFFIYSLIDGSEMHFQNGRDPFSVRWWGAFDGNPIIDAANDRFVWAGENGVVYNVRLNTNFDAEAGTISISPETTRYRMVGSRRLGTENSIAVFGYYGFFADNAGWITCVNLRTMEPVWVFDAGDDTDASIVLDWEEENQRLVLFTGTQVDLQGHGGSSFLRKMDAATGEVLWEHAIRCAYHTAVNGGILATPLVGRGDISNLVIFWVARVLDRGGGGALIAYDRQTGEGVWERIFQNWGWSTPTAVYNRDGVSHIVVSDSAGRMFLLRGVNGEILYSINVGANVEASPAIFNNILVVGTRGQRILGIEIG